MLSAVTSKAVSAAVCASRRTAAHSCCEGVSGSALADGDKTFADRHIGPNDAEVRRMLSVIGESHGRSYETLDELTNATIPESIKIKRPLAVGPPKSEATALEELQRMASKNRTLKSFIGMGYNAAIVPQVILRNVLLNPGWYTPYTPYQAEVSQGRLEAMLAFQTMISDLTGMPVSNCSLLDEATAAAEAVRMCATDFKTKKGAKSSASPVVVISEGLHPQNIDVIKTRTRGLGIEISVVADVATEVDRLVAEGRLAGALVAYPTTLGTVEDYSALGRKIHDAGALFVVDADLLSLAVLKEPAKFGADVCLGSAGRFGLPMGYGGAHAGFLATTEKLKRAMPGRLIGVSRDAAGKTALRMAIQTREQHIKREKASSNLCTASALMAQMAAFYAMWHGPKGIRCIAECIHDKAERLRTGLGKLGVETLPGTIFDTVVATLPSEEAARVAHERARARGMNLRPVDSTRVGVSIDETTTEDDVAALLAVISGNCGSAEYKPAYGSCGPATEVPEQFRRTTPYLTHAVFNSCHNETAMMRYLFGLQTKDIGLNSRMVALGSCTMKLNAAAEMAPITWPEFANMHPFAPADQARGYHEMLASLEKALCDVTGFHAASLQPNSGAAGEYAGLMTIRNTLEARDGNRRRDICLIPVSAHGTNPASASLAGLETVVVKCDAQGNIDVEDLRAKAQKHAERLCCVMMTYPSTHGVYEDTFKACAKIVHDLGGLVYMDGANMNAQVGLIKPAELGADVCHLNLHKTFAMPHGGGGPGMGPICCTKELAPHLPGHSVVKAGPALGNSSAVSAAPWGSASLLPISWMYVHMLGSKGLRKATQAAVLNANYMASRLKKHYKVLFAHGPTGACAHEFILDMHPFARAGVDATDVAKRLIDYGFHAPTLSFPVAGTLMIEPTESEPLSELDRFCDALIAIKGEIDAIESGELDRTDNPLKNAPHTAREVSATEWKHKYSRELAAYPVKVLLKDKYWSPVKRVDNTWGDLHLIPTLPARFDD